MSFEEDPPTKIIRSKNFFDNVSYRFIEMADEALYEAKKSGRNKVCTSKNLVLPESK